jgi:hypothetical protein
VGEGRLRRSAGRAGKGVTAAQARRLALALPAVEEGPSYGTPGYRVGGKLFARFRDEGATLVVGIDQDLRDGFLQANPKAFFVTDHYRNYDWMLVRLDAVTRGELEDMLRLAWSRKASKRLVAAAG